LKSRSGHKGFDRDAAVRQVRFLASDIAEVTGRSIVRATNIREYLSREWGGRQFDYDSMECCMPPFPLVWWVDGDQVRGGMASHRRDGQFPVAEGQGRIRPVLLRIAGRRSERRQLAMPFYILGCTVNDDGRWEGVTLVDGNQGFHHMDELDEDEQVLYMETAVVVFQTSAS